MAVARKCDRCGAYFDIPEDVHPSGFYWMNGAGAASESIDLCADCCDKLSEWIEGERETLSESKSENVEMFRKIQHAEVEAVEDTRSASESLPEHVNCLCKPESKPEPEKIPYEKPVVGDSVGEVTQEKGFVSLLEEEEIAEAPQSEPEPTDEEIPEEPEERGEVVTSKPDEPESVSLEREMAKDFFTGMTYGEIADKYRVNKKKVTNSLHAFKKRCPDEYAEIALGANR